MKVQVINQNTPPNSLNIGVGIEAKKPRSSNFELYRIICMLMIVAGHFVCNGGLFSKGGPLTHDFFSTNSIYLSLFGVWGKTGINCFVMITGYFMCTSKITVRKFVKLMSQIYFYKITIFLILLFSGYETISILRLFKLIMPFWGFGNGFVPCFIVFWLTIPFLSILVRNLNQRQHQLLLLLSLTVYSLLGSLPTFNVSFNYISWFGIIFFVASYIRLYPNKIFDNRRLWGCMTLLSVLLASLSILGLRLFFCHLGYFLVIDSNKLFAVVIAVSSFLWFKNLDIRYSRVINAFGSGTFGVLLIHSNSNAMRTWLWKDTVDVVGHYTLPLGSLILYSIVVTLAVFVVCNLIDQLRIATLEKWFFKIYDDKVSFKLEKSVFKLLKV